MNAQRTRRDWHFIEQLIESFIESSFLYAINLFWCNKRIDAHGVLTNDFDKCVS